METILDMFFIKKKLTSLLHPLFLLLTELVLLPVVTLCGQAFG